MLEFKVVYLIYEKIDYKSDVCVFLILSYFNVVMNKYVIYICDVILSDSYFKWFCILFYKLK